MPLFTRPKWNGYEIHAKPTERDFFRSSDICRLLPYFWDSPICFDFSIYPYKVGRTNNDKSIDYEWELCGLDDKPIKDGKDSIVIPHKSITTKKWTSKESAFYLGYLPPNQHYRLRVRVKDLLNNKSDWLVIAAFTVKDRDDYYIQMLILIVGIGFTTLLWLLGG